MNPSARILLVEDFEPERVALARALRAAGYVVVQAADGRQAIDLFRREPCDLVITDLIMPEKEGLETILELRHRNPAVEIIAMSGGGRFGDFTYLKIAECFGVQRILQKPFGLEQLLATVSSALGRPPTATASEPSATPKNQADP